MKKALAFIVCVLFVLTTNSFALWGIGEKKPTTSEAKGTIHAKEMGKGKHLGIIKKETKAEKIKREKKAKIEKEKKAKIEKERKAKIETKTK